MSLSNRIASLVQLGDYILSHPEELSLYILRSKQNNPWFTEETISQSLKAIAINYLSENSLKKWVGDYDFNESDKTIGLILAGNIPLVGFHDVLCCLITGRKAEVKLSDKDNILIPFLVNKLNELDTVNFKEITFVNRLKDYQAVIATGSDTTGNYFEKYFSNVNHIIRKNRNAIGVVYNNTSEENLKALGSDIFTYYGLGCRNVSKLYFQEGIDLNRFFEAIHDFKDVINHHKYKNNYDYNHAIFLLNKEAFLTNNFLALVPSKHISSRIASCHYEYFEDENVLANELKLEQDKIQCIVSDRALQNHNIVLPGSAQKPQLNDYADGVDTLAFILEN